MVKLELYIYYTLLHLQSSVSKSRKKRQSFSLATFCEPRFIQLDSQSDQFVLVWLCRDNDTEPSLADQAQLCGVLFDAGLMGSCKPPNGREMAPPTIPPLTDSRYAIVTAV